MDGDLTYDPNKDLTLSYNHMHLPYRAQNTTGSNRIEWLYDASGKKVQQKIFKNGSLAQTTDYLDGIEYTSTGTTTPTLDAIYHEEGRYLGASQKYEFVLRDHLGSTRVSFIDADNNGSISTSEITQENYYYPFGMKMKGPWSNTNSYKYQYNSKENVTDLGLNLSDYGARWYDASIGRWAQSDPLAELAPDLTTYRYAYNNPILYFDPDGMFESKEQAKDYAKSHGIRTGFLSRNKIRETGDGGYAIENKSKNTSIIDYGGDIGVLEGVLIGDKDVIKSDMGGDQFGGISSRHELRDGSIESRSIFGPLDLIGGLGHAQKPKIGLKLLDELPTLDQSGKIHMNLSRLPKIEELLKYPKQDLANFLKDLRVSVKNRIKSTSLKGPNASRIQNRSHGQRQGEEQNLIKSLEKHLEDRK